MSAKRIAEIKARVVVASDEPWVASGGNAPDSEEFASYINTPSYSAMTELTFDDATFAAHARADVPWLLAQLEEARRLARMFLDIDISGTDWCEYDAKLKAWE